MFDLVRHLVFKYFPLIFDCPRFYEKLLNIDTIPTHLNTLTLLHTNWQSCYSNTNSQ